MSVDLTTCDQEPIRTPGAVQPHGHLLVLDGATGRLVAYGGSQSLTQAQEMAAAVRVPDGLPVGGASVSIGRLAMVDGLWDASAHRTPRHLIVELEPAVSETGNLAPIYSLARSFLPELQNTGTVLELAQLATLELKRLTGFGRCLLYRFDDEGHGEVLAERADEGYDRYLGHRFPAPDIPQQARALYLLNRFRLIPDAHYEPVPLMSLDPALGPTDIDLSQAFLRRVSPVHLEYMRNMGTLASMSVSIVVDGKLWGLISCHDHQPRSLTPECRNACDHLGQLVSLQIAAKEANADVAERLELRKLTLEIVSRLGDSDATLQRILAEPAPLLRLARASGAAIVLDDQVWSVGDVPAREQIEELAGWIVGLGQDVYESHELTARFSPAAQFDRASSGHNVAGVLALSISQVHRHAILWFRPEIVQTVRWAGDPRAKIIENGRIQPRRSFDSWAEQIKGRSEPWSAAEIATARELREALIGIVLRRAEEMAVVAQELGRLNKELEAFSYTVSHDLRAPMRHITGYVDLVLDTDEAALSERSLRYLGHVKDAALYAGQLVDALLDFSRMGRAALKRRNVNTQLLVDDLVKEITRQERGQDIEWAVDRNLPDIDADPLLLQMAVRNLVSNAVKYSRSEDRSHIAVTAVSNEDGDGLEVHDNGVGFDMKYVDKLFGVFQRLHKSEEFEGTGIGLANTKRIIERHGGRVWAYGEAGKGARFGFTVPKQATASQAPPGVPDA
ncbi:ATP-binding protein [Uliginosibacterium sp. H1]|uniref:ATP-binding protein n=1 Tax=Uliginosibacterium sp. H1 TaxID=3114757 RepID=UPI002E187FFF|nr:ATP-binding protein [Uliginosibacterium sp. H1]